MIDKTDLISQVETHIEKVRTLLDLEQDLRSDSYTNLCNNLDMLVRLHDVLEFQQGMLARAWQDDASMVESLDFFPKRPKETS